MVAVTGEVTSTEPIVRKSAVRSACEGRSRLVSTCVREIGSRKATARGPDSSPGTDTCHSMLAFAPLLCRR